MAMTQRSFPGTLDSIGRICDLVTEAAGAAGLDERAVYRLCLAVDEVATNIVLHGYEEAGREGALDVTVTVDDRAVTVTLEDDAAPFDPTARPLPTAEDLAKPVEERPIGGLGLMLAIGGVDELRYERLRERNRNVFVVRRPPASQPTGEGSAC
jgi:serine/threonine-protein kinase RsbW